MYSLFRVCAVHIDNSLKHMYVAAGFLAVVEVGVIGDLHAKFTFLMCSEKAL